MEFLLLEDYPCLQEHVNELCGDVIPTLKLTGGCLQKELGLVMVSAENCVVAGFIRLCPEKSKHGISFAVKRFEVLEECIPEGWDKMLLREAEKRARELGHTQITVEVSLCRGTIFQDMGYSTNKNTSSKNLRKRLVFQRSPVHSQPLALLQQLCDILTLVEEKNAEKYSKEATLLIVPWIQQLSGAGFTSCLVCCNMASMYTVQPRAVKCMLKRDGSNRISLDDWNLCSLKTHKMDRRNSEGRFDEDSDSQKRRKTKSLRIKNGKSKVRRIKKSSSFSLSSKDVFAVPMLANQGFRSRSNSVDQAVLRDALAELPLEAKPMEFHRRSTYDYASNQSQNTDYIRVSSPAVIELGMAESTTGMDLIVTKSESSSPTHEHSIVSHSFSVSYDETVAVGPPPENEFWIPRVRRYTVPIKKKTSAVTRNSAFPSGPSKTLTPPGTLIEFDRHEPLINEDLVYETECKWDKDEIVPILQDERKKLLRDKDGKLLKRESSSHLFGWTAPAPMRGGHIGEQTSFTSPTQGFSRDLLARDLIPSINKSRSNTTPNFAQSSSSLQVRTPDAKWSRSAEHRFSEHTQCTSPNMGEVRHPLSRGYKRRTSRHKRTSSFPLFEGDVGVDALRAKGESETGPALPLGDSDDLVQTVQRLSALNDRSAEVTKDKPHPRFKGGPSLTNVPQIPEHSELFNLLHPLIKAQKALEFGSLDAHTQPSPSKFKKSRELLQSLLRELREVLPKESQRERVIAMATSGWSLMKNQRLLKSQHGKKIDSRSIAKLYNKEEFGLHVTAMKFSTDLIWHYVVHKFMPVCVPYGDLVLLSDSAATAGGRQTSTGSCQLYMLIVGCVEDTYRQYLYGTQRVFVVMFPRREGLHLCSEKDLLYSTGSLRKNSHREGSSEKMLVFSLN